QAVKTPPSHGGNRGSIPLSAVDYFEKNSPTLEDAESHMTSAFFMHRKKDSSKFYKKTCAPTFFGV
ncbi:MAG: hypothetical protein J1E64_13575, partial [Acetatifactor sp.]|nr:hypothetical protein [Acetatifactor sp.]